MYRYDVYVGNIGCVRSGVSRAEALRVFEHYKGMSELGLGRCAGESVAVMQVSENGEATIYKDYIGELEKNNHGSERENYVRGEFPPLVE